MLIKSNEEITPVECVSDMQYSYTPHVSGGTFISHTVYSCVRPFDMIPVSEVQIPSNM